MSIQEKKPKRRISRNLEIEPDYAEVKDMSMQYKSVSPVQLNKSRNRGKTESKIMLKKMRSMKLSKLYSLKKTEKRAIPQLDWQSTDSSSNEYSSSIHSSPDRMKKAISLSDGKRETFQGQGESESEGTSPTASSYGSFGTAPFSKNQIPGKSEQKTIRKSNKHACPSCFRPFTRRPNSRLSNPAIEVEAPNYLKANSHSAGLEMKLQATPRNSESSFFSSDESRTSSMRYSQPSSATSSQKSLQALTKSSSVRKLRSRTTFKAKSSSAKKNLKISQDLSLNRPTCSSTLKDSKFQKEAEEYPGQTESEIISVKKVCPYNHCSLHGHSHAPEAPPKRFSYLRRRSMKKQNVVKPKRLSTDGVASSVGIKKTFQTTTTSIPVKNDLVIDAKQRDDPIRGPSQDNEDTDVAAILLGEKSHHAESADENLNEVQKFSVLEKDTMEPVLTELQKPSDCSVEMKDDGSVVGIDNAPLHVEITSASYPGLIKDEPLTFEQASKDSSEAKRKSFEIYLPSSHPLEELGASEEKNGPADPEEALISLTSLDKEFETNGPSVTLHQARKPLIKKNNHISMWHMIHQQMVLGLAEEGESQQFSPADDEGQVNDANPLPGTNSVGLGPDISNSELATKNHDTVNKDLELRKIFAIKMVREAIEKILLPEVDDQSSDMVSVTNEAIGDEKLSGKKRDKSDEPEDKPREIDNNALVDDKSLITEKASQADYTPSVPEEENSRKNSDKQPLKGWSNLRKIILLKRFVRELEKVKKFNPVKPQLLPLQPESEGEKVSLRPQTIGEKKSAEEWMLDYALRQVVSQLAPTQKRKVALLVKAFETVVPSEDATSEAMDPQQKNEDFSASNPISSEKSYATDLSTPTSKGSQLHSNPSLKSKSDDTMDYLYENLLVDSEEQETKGMASNFNSEHEGPESSDKYMELNRSSNAAGKPPCAVNGSATEKNTETNAAKIIPPTSDSDRFVKAFDRKEAMDKESGLEHVVHREFPLLVDFKPDSIVSRDHKAQLNKQNIKMWHMIYQHVVSGIAAKVGNQLLDGSDEEEVDDTNILPVTKSFGSIDVNIQTNHDDVGKENHDINHEKIEFSKSIAVKLVQEAVDEILLPEIQDDSSDSQSVASDIFLDQDLIEKQPRDGEEAIIILNSREFAEDTSFKESGKDKVEDGVSLYRENEASLVGNTSSKDDERAAASMVKNRFGQQKSKNWSKLKKLILLKRSIKALENVRKFNPRPAQELPLAREPEEEKVDLRRQMMDERKKAEQWMLDYAVQHIVTTLTPARKRRVAMLVEAFEAVVPLPEA